MADYVTLETMRTYLNQGDEFTVGTTYDALIQDAITSASREVEQRTDRVFFQEADVSTRTFDCYGSGLLLVDDISTDTGLLIDGEALTDDHKLFPRNGIVSGQSGHPYTRIKSCTFYEGCSYEITARWGWAAVPEPIVEVVKMLAAETFLAKDTPHGVSGFNEMGALRVRERVHIEKKLKLYAKDPIGFA